MSYKFILLSFFTVLSQILHSQELTIGLLDINYDKVSEGLTLFTPWYSDKTYLINNCGQVVNQWEDEVDQGLSSSALDGSGNLFLLRENTLSISNWEGDQILKFTGESWNMNFHHDFTLLPNGHVIILFDEEIDIEEAIDLGLDSTLYDDPHDHLILDGFAEFNISNADEPILVWEWHLKDHLIQNLNSELNNFHDPADQPNRLNINFDAPSYDLLDWTHFNGVDYNPITDQLVFSSRSTSEIYIIDHSTDSSEAAGSTGGAYGRGGDFLWRWGNPQQYGQDPALRKTYLQHDPTWNLYGPDAYEGITLFNNENAQGSASSSIVSLVPEKDNDGQYIKSEGRYGPDVPNWEYIGMEDEFFSPIMSSAQLLKNGNYNSCLGRFGKFYELTPEGEIVWEYQSPLFFSIVPQFENPPASATFSIRKYPMDYPGFNGKDLSGNSIIEDFNFISNACIQTTSNDNLDRLVSTTIYPNPARNDLQFDSKKTLDWIEVYDINGALIMSCKFQKSIDVSHLPKGHYHLKLTTKDVSEWHKFIVI